MELDHVNEFLVLARICNYSQAAHELFTTQATLSRHIVGLEKRLGKPLFSRSTRRVELTEFGKSFLPYARKLVQTMEECKAYLLDEELESKKNLTVGAIGPILLYDVIKDSLMRFTVANPGCRFGIIPGDEEQLKEKLRQHLCNFIIIREPADWTDDDFNRLTVARDSLCVVLPKTHPLAGDERIPLEQLANESFIMPSEHTLAYRTFVKQCQLAGFEPKVVSTLQPQEFMVGLVHAGMGVTVLCKTAALDAADPSVSVIELDPPMNEDINILYPQLSRLPQVTELALKYFEQALSAKRHLARVPPPTE